MKCHTCGKEFEGRADARYCSAACRKKASRAKESDFSETMRDPEKAKAVIEKAAKAANEEQKRLVDSAIPFEQHGDNPGDHIASEFVAHKGGIYTYHETYQRDDGSKYRVVEHSQWSPEQVNKLRSQTPSKIRVAGYGMAEHAPSPKVVKGWKKA